MARIWGVEKGEGGTSEERMTAYLDGLGGPQQALPPRVIYVACEGDALIGYIAGHLTRRFGCDGELQWISIRQEYRGRGVGAELLRRLAKWFASHDALWVCVDVEPANAVAKRFYARHGAEDLKPHWMVWKDIRRAHGPPFS